MGNKICGDETGTPWVNFSINCVRVSNSENIKIDRPDGKVSSCEDISDDEEPIKRCCLPWPKRFRTKV
jgi:hypothetical protein